MRTKFTKNQIYIFIICMGMFINATTLRLGAYNNILLQRYSPLIYIGIALLYLKKEEKYDLFEKKISNKIFLWYIILNIFIIIERFVFDEMYRRLSIIISLLFPMCILAFRFVNKESFKQAFNIFYYFLKISTLIIILGGLIDLCTNFSVTRFIADYTDVPSYTRILKQRRIVSYMGHPLFTSEILLVFYIFSHYFSILNNRKEKIIDFIFALIGILLCQSRTAILLLLILYLMYNFKVERIRYLVIIAVIFTIFYYIGLFDNIINRFYQFKDGDIRTTSFDLLIEEDMLKFNIFEGQNVDNISEASRYAAALEYPIYRWAYIFGIAASIGISVFIFVIPLLQIFKDKQYLLAMSLLILITDVNTYSSMADIGMKQTFFYMIVCLLINLSKFLKKDNISYESFKQDKDMDVFPKTIY